MSEILQIFQHSPPSHQQMTPHIQRGVLHDESEFNRCMDSGFPSPGIFDVTVQSSDQLDGNPFMDFSSSSVDELSKVTAVIGRNQRLKKKRKLEVSNLTDSKPDYIHVRARRGEATDTHSLAERARREKIKKKMQYLQDLVPGCNKLNNKAAILDEIITYIQSLQVEIEFLAIKLAALTTSHVSLEDGQFIIA